MKKITKIALAMFVGVMIVFESDTIPLLVDVALKSFGKESARMENKNRSVTKN